MRFFLALAPSAIVAINILGEHVTTLSKNKNYMVILDRFSELVQMVLLLTITAKVVAKAFVTHSVMAYGHLRRLLSDNGKHFTPRLFQHVCKILVIENFLTTTYHPHTNSQLERYNRTITAGLCLYVKQHLTE